MSELKAKLRSDLTAAMKARDTLTLGTLRMALAAITNEEVVGEHGAGADRRRGDSGAGQRGEEAQGVRGGVRRRRDAVNWPTRNGPSRP